MELSTSESFENIIVFTFNSDIIHFFDSLNTDFGNFLTSYENSLNSSALSDERELLKKQTSDISFVKVFNNLQQIEETEIDVFIDENGQNYSGAVLYSLSGTYHKAANFTKDLIESGVKAIVSNYSSNTSQDTPLSDSIDNVLFLLETEVNNPKLLSILNEANKSSPYKSSALPVGKLYKELNTFFFESNRRLVAQEQLTRRNFININILDLRQFQESNTTRLTNNSEIAIFSNEEKFIYDPLTSTISSELDYRVTYSSPEGDGTKAVTLLTSGIQQVESHFYFDLYKALNLKSELSKFLNIFNIEQAFRNIKIRDFFTLLHVKAEVLDPRNYGDIPIHIDETSVDSEGKFYSPNSIDDVHSVDLVLPGSYIIPRTMATPHIQVENSDYVEEYFNNNSGLTFLSNSSGATISNFYEMIFFEHFMNAKLLQPGVEWRDPDAIYEIDWNRAYKSRITEFTENNIDPDKKIRLTATFKDNTMQFYDFYLRHKLEQAAEDFKLYYDHARDFCSYNNIDGRFNDFFLNSIDDALQGKLNFQNSKPWETIANYFVLFDAIVNASYSNGEISSANRISTKDIDLDNCNRNIRNLAISLSPKNGDLRALVHFYTNRLVPLLAVFEQGSGLDSQNNIYRTDAYNELKNAQIETSFTRTKLIKLYPEVKVFLGSIPIDGDPDTTFTGGIDFPPEEPVPGGGEPEIGGSPFYTFTVDDPENPSAGGSWKKGLF